MVYGIQQRLGSLIDHYTVLCLTLALVILSLIGVGDVRVAGMAGIFLCLAGITRVMPGWICGYCFRLFFMIWLRGNIFPESGD